MRLLTADEVAVILSVSTARVYELARTNAIPALKLGERQVRFDETALRKWIALASDRNCSATQEDQY
ncbi:MAG: helix-turn-helix domain-containing protein [Acidobacteria bacterium]|nr:helix-turn-helix domain-containing protein [Acidobacteriota bacterium]MCA1627662.1 helix-turn-helix domain-containing protein [Acidobacteriota bacterium]